MSFPIKVFVSPVSIRRRLRALKAAGPSPQWPGLDLHCLGSLGSCRTVLLKLPCMELTGELVRMSDSAGLGRVLGSCISNKLPGISRDQL